MQRTPVDRAAAFIAEADPASRTQFQRDRDRIIHSAAFRRLEYKTQVFVNHEGDLFRTRLTHSLEVAQIGRAVACNLGLNEDLVEAISLAHDLGHTPFGHAGQDALHECMKPHGGFEHNLQSLRVVDVLEERYAAFDGLNLTFETREGILKHCSAKNARDLGEVGKRFLTKQQPSLEAQIANLADEIAYSNHDIDDGLRSGLLQLAQLEQVPLFARHSATCPGRISGACRAPNDSRNGAAHDQHASGRSDGRVEAAYCGTLPPPISMPSVQPRRWQPFRTGCAMRLMNSNRSCTISYIGTIA